MLMINDHRTYIVFSFKIVSIVSFTEVRDWIFKLAHSDRSSIDFFFVYWLWQNLRNLLLFWWLSCLWLKSIIIGCFLLFDGWGHIRYIVPHILVISISRHTPHINFIFFIAFLTFFRQKCHIHRQFQTIIDHPWYQFLQIRRLFLQCRIRIYF